MLTQLSVFWFDFLSDVTPTHFLTADVDEYPEPLRQYRDQLEGRSMLVKRAQDDGHRVRGARLPGGLGLEGVPRDGHVCAAFPLPPGLKESDKLPEPIFTPATKAQTGHDENISFDAVASSWSARSWPGGCAIAHAGDLHQRGALRGDAAAS